MKCQHQGGNHGGWFPYQCSMYGIFTNIYPLTDPNVGKHSIHGGYLLMYWRTKRLHCSSKDTPLPVLRLFVLFGSAFIVVHVWTVWGTVRGLWNPTQEIVSRSNNAIPERTLSYYQSSMTSNPQNWGLDRLIPKILHHSKQLRGTQTGILGPKEIQTDKTNAPLPRSGAVLQAAGNGFLAALSCQCMQGWILFFLFRTKNMQTYTYIYMVYIEDIYIYIYICTMYISLLLLLLHIITIITHRIHVCYIYGVPWIPSTKNPNKMSMILRDRRQLGWSSAGLSHVVTWFL